MNISRNIPAGGASYQPAHVWAPPGRHHFPRSSQLEVIAHAAWHRGCNVRKLSSSLFQVSHGAQTVSFIDRMSDRTSNFARGATNDKEATKKLLEAAGLRVPAGRIFKPDEAEDAWNYGASLGRPFVIKPLSGSGGSGVAVGISLRERFNQAWERAATRRKMIIVEPMIVGADYRVFVIENKVVAAAKRWPASVMGDGKHTIAELIILKNRERRRIPYVGKDEFELTPLMRDHLAQQGLIPEVVPVAGQRIQLLAIANISAGGDSEDVTDTIHPSFCDIAVRARQAIPGLFHAGIDILAADITAPAEDQEWAICEVNSNPDTSLHHFPVVGAARDVAGALIEAVLPTTAPNQPRPRRAVELRITGKVHGVNYRRWLSKTAQLHSVDGWVRNVDDGSVLAGLYGPQNAVHAVVERCHRGPKQAGVTAVERRVLARTFKPGFALLPDVSATSILAPPMATHQNPDPAPAQGQALSFVSFESFIQSFRATYGHPRQYPAGVISDHRLGFEWACTDLDIDIVHESGGKWKFIRNGRVIGHMNNMVSSLSTSNAVSISKNKIRTFNYLKKAGVPVPRSASFKPDQDGFNAARSYWKIKREAFDIVVKPSHGRAGRGVTVGVASENGFSEAWSSAVAWLSKDHHRVVIEERLKGCDFRVIVVNGQVACAASRVPAYVIGDGARPLESLVADKNTERKKHPHHRLHKISIGPHLDPQYIPGNRETVFLSDKANVHQGGEAIDVTRFLPDSVRQVAISACSAIPGMGVAGVDVIYASPAVSEPKVIETNTSANFGIHYFPLYGYSCNPARTILEEMMESVEGREAA